MLDFGRLGSAVSDAQWEEATNEFVAIIKKEGRWDIWNNTLHPNLPFKTINLYPKVQEAGGKLVHNQYGERMAVTWNHSEPDIVNITETPFAIGNRSFKKSGVKIPVCLCDCANWQDFANQCPYPKGSEERRGWFFQARCVGKFDYTKAHGAYKKYYG